MAPTRVAAECPTSIRPGAITLIANVTATAASEDRCETRGGSRPLNETGVRESPFQEVEGSPFDLSDAPNIDRYGTLIPTPESPRIAFSFRVPWTRQTSTFDLRGHPDSLVSSRSIRAVPAALPAGRQRRQWTHRTAWPDGRGTARASPAALRALGGILVRVTASQLSCDLSSSSLQGTRPLGQAVHLFGIQHWCIPRADSYP